MKKLKKKLRTISELPLTLTSEKDFFPRKNLKLKSKRVCTIENQ